MIVLTLLIGVLAIGGLINETNADSNGPPDFPFLMTTVGSASPIQSEQSEETVGEDPILQEMAVKYYVKNTRSREKRPENGLRSRIRRPASRTRSPNCWAKILPAFGMTPGAAAVCK